MSALIPMRCCWPPLLSRIWCKCISQRGNAADASTQDQSPEPILWTLRILTIQQICLTALQATAHSHKINLATAFLSSDCLTCCGNFVSTDAHALPSSLLAHSQIGGDIVFLGVTEEIQQVLYRPLARDICLHKEA